MKEEISGKVITNFFGLKAKTYSHLKDNNDEDKKSKVKKMWDIQI